MYNILTDIAYINVSITHGGKALHAFSLAADAGTDEVYHGITHAADRKEKFMRLIVKIYCTHTRILFGYFAALVIVRSLIIYCGGD